jgi:hypothetical protein
MGHNKMTSHTSRANEKVLRHIFWSLKLQNLYNVGLLPAKHQT